MAAASQVVAAGGTQAGGSALHDADIEEEYHPLIPKEASKNCLICHGIGYRYVDRAPQGQIDTPRFDLLELVDRYGNSAYVENVIQLVKSWYRKVKSRLVVERKGEEKPAPEWKLKSIEDHFHGLHGSGAGIDPLTFSLNHAVAGAHAASQVLRCADGSINKVASEIHISYLKRVMDVSKELAKAKKPVLGKLAATTSSALKHKKRASK